MEYSNPFESPSSLQLAAWTLRLGSDPTFGVALMADPHIFSLYYASCAAVIEPPKKLRGAVLTREIGGEGLLSVLKDLTRQFGEAATGRYTNCYLEGLSVFENLVTKDYDTRISLMKRWQAKAEEEVSKWTSAQEQNIDRLGKLLGLSEQEKRLLTFQLNRGAAGFRYLYDAFMSTPEVAALTLSKVLDIDRITLLSMLAEDSPLVRSGLLIVQERPLAISSPSEHLRAVLNEKAANMKEFAAHFVEPLVPSATTGSLARFDERDEAMLVRLMAMRVPKEHGLHVLTYGPRAINKKDLLARIFQREGVTAFAVVEKDVPPSDIAVWVHVAQCYLMESNRNAVLVVDRAELALAGAKLSLRSIFGLEEAADPDAEGRASDEGLTGSRVRCVWMSDRAKALSEKNLGRFLLHIEARPGSRADRRERIAAALAETNLGPDLETHLAKYSLLAEGPVRQAVRLANLIHEPSDTEGLTETIKRAVHQSQKALGRDATEDLRNSVTHYDLSLLNLASSFTPQQIVSSLKKKGRGTLLFHGIPGAGKTQFAEYLAVELDKPLLIKRASDILSKWLGESEQNIASMFEEAAEEGAILFIDEADSFLRDRSMARAEWSVTQVNEILQHLERAEGIVVCATNLMNDIDAAAMRRFTFKIEFLPLKPEQSWQMFCAEAGFDAEGAGEEATAKVRERLFKIKNLAPGDFATCKRMALILEDDQPMGIEEWLTQLEQEAKAKMHGLQRNQLGFAKD